MERPRLLNARLCRAALRVRFSGCGRPHPACVRDPCVGRVRFPRPGAPHGRSGSLAQRDRGKELRVPDAPNSFGSPRHDCCSAGDQRRSGKSVFPDPQPPEAAGFADIERILHSPNSEDYVTWNFFQLLDSVPASSWWPNLLKLAGESSIDPGDCPVVRLWQTVAAPRSYEVLSRERMRAAENEKWRRRSLNIKPVEGPFEIDITFEGRSYLVFVEAKLGSHVQLNTKYDPERNQIARNIDCVFDRCGSRRPAFWMFVRDHAATRAYVQLMERYRSASELQRALPHRAPAQLLALCADLAVVTWADLLKLLAGVSWSAPEVDVELELRRRVILP